MCNTRSQNNKRLIFRNSSILFLGLGLLTCAAVIVQALASPPSSNNMSPWGTRGGAHVGTATKKSKGSSSSSYLPSTTQSALSMSPTNEEANNNSDRDVEITNVEKIPSPLISPLNGISATTNNNKEASVSSASTLANAHRQHHPNSPLPVKAKKTILTQGGFADEIIPAAYVAETNLPTDVGHFRIRAYRIEELEDAMKEPHPLGRGAGLGSEPCIIYCTDKPPFGPKGGKRGGAKDVPVRIHDQCFTSEVFRSQR